MLLKSGADANLAMADGRTPMHIAAESGNIGVIKLLLENEADIFATDQVYIGSIRTQSTVFQHWQIFQDGETALHKACKMCNYSVLKCLIDYAKDNRPADFQDYINAVNTKGETALHYISILPTSSGKRLVSQHTGLTVFSCSFHPHVCN